MHFIARNAVKAMAAEHGALKESLLGIGSSTLAISSTPAESVCQPATKKPRSKLLQILDAEAPKWLSEQPTTSSIHPHLTRGATHNDVARSSTYATCLIP